MQRDLSSSSVVVSDYVLADMNLSNMLLSHNKPNASATEGVREHVIQISFSEVKSDQTSVMTISEKPFVSHFVSAGVCGVEPEIMRSVPQGQYLNMPDLLNDTIASGHD